MKSILLQEMHKILLQEETMGVMLPKPCYLFVQKYGRSVEAEMEEISKLMGRKSQFYFKAESSQKEQAILRRFLMEQERHAGLGKVYSGCVLIELSGEEADKELYDLLEYLDEHRNRISSLFTTKNFQKVDFLRQQMEQFFFVRVVDGEKYDAPEQQTLFESIMESYHMILGAGAKSELELFFQKREWQETDMVEKRIRNFAKDIVYDKMLGGIEPHNIVRKEEIVEAIKCFTEKCGKKNTIGFVMGG